MDSVPKVRLEEMNVTDQKRNFSLEEVEQFIQNISVTLFIPFKKDFVAPNWMRTMVEEEVNHELVALRCFCNPGYANAVRPTEEEIGGFISGIPLRVMLRVLLYMKVEIGVWDTISILKKFRQQRQLKSCHIPLVEIYIEPPYEMDFHQVIEENRDFISSFTKSNVFLRCESSDKDMEILPTWAKIKVPTKYGYLLIFDDTEDWKIDYRESKKEQQ